MDKIVGVFITCVLCTNCAWGYVTENVVAGCNGPMIINAVFQKSTYQCNAGYYLPAGAEKCQICPENYTCPGGTYDFDESKSQGLIFDALITENVPNGCKIELSGKSLVAIYIPTDYSCDAGYYLPANQVECTICKQNNYCPGGIYSFDETIDQGIASCPDDLYAPNGMWEFGQCGRILNIGTNMMYLRSEKKTEPSLNVDINNDGNPDFFANMSIDNVYINSDADKSLKIKYNDIVYSVYDDTIYGNTY